MFILLCQSQYSKKKNTALSEQFQNLIEKSQKEAKSIPQTQIHDRLLSWLGTGTSIKSGGIKLVLWDQISPLSEMMRSCKYIPCVIKMSTFIQVHTMCD